MPSPFQRTEVIECDRCGKPREVRIYRSTDLANALDRLCTGCGYQAWIESVDDIAVERLISGDRPRIVTPAERREAVAYLTRSSLSAQEIARRIGCSQRTVVRHRSRINQ